MIVTPCCIQREKCQNLAVYWLVPRKLYSSTCFTGDWNARCGVYEEDSINIDERLNAKSYDEDADVDETDDWDSEAREVRLSMICLSTASICVLIQAKSMLLYFSTFSLLCFFALKII